MSQDRMHTYEALFLFPQSASADLQAALDHVNELFRRANAEILALSKWDERRLAYEISGNKRGVYFHAYFRADGARIQGLERDCNLSEKLLRAMVLRADHELPETITAAEGRETLADEIRLRRERGPATEAVTAGGGDEADEETPEYDDEL
ncbi:MAG: 30S ribosomal protein S6 [Phycisphaeraceae bacterium]|nr:30S ribosomal protein S6 [Phycisphaeraceae bacterium]